MGHSSPFARLGVSAVQALETDCDLLEGELQEAASRCFFSAAEGVSGAEGRDQSGGLVFEVPQLRANFYRSFWEGCPIGYRKMVPLF